MIKTAYGFQIDEMTEQLLYDPEKEPVLHLYNENLEKIAEITPYDHKCQFSKNYGWWLAAVKIVDGTKSEPFLFELRFESKGKFTYKASTCPPKMAKKEEFLQKVQALLQGM